MIGRSNVTNRTFSISVAMKCIFREGEQRFEDIATNASLPGRNLRFSVIGAAADESLGMIFSELMAPLTSFFRRTELVQLVPALPLNCAQD